MTSVLPKVVLVVGTKNSGKTRYLELLVKNAQHAGLNTAGFLSRGDKRKEKYYLEDIRSNERFLMATKKSGKIFTLPCGDYYFDPLIIEKGNRLLKEQVAADLLVLDEWGPLEWQGKGLRDAFDYLCVNYRGILCIAVRPSFHERLLTILTEDY